MLLCLQHQQGHLTERDMLKICKSYDEDIWRKFDEKDGKFYNKRMVLEAEKRNNYVDSRRKNRVAKNEEKDMTDISQSYDEHMENENENKDDNEILNENTVVIKEEIAELYERVILYFDEDLHPKTLAVKKHWCDTLDKLIRIDKYTPEHIETIIHLARSDNFWKQNFLSLMKLRKLNPEGVTYFKVFEKKLLTNGKQTGVTRKEITDIIAKHFTGD